MAKVKIAGKEFRQDFDTPLGRKIKTCSDLLTFEEGDVILKQGSIVPGLFLVSRGILGAKADAGDGISRFLYPILHGMCYSPFPTGKNRSDATLFAIADSYVYLLPDEKFAEMIASDPEFMGMIGELINHTFSANTLMITVGRMPSAKHRLQAVMRVLSILQPLLGPDAASPIESRINQTLMAEMLGVTRPYLNQLVKSLRLGKEQE